MHNLYGRYYVEWIDFEVQTYFSLKMHSLMEIKNIRMSSLQKTHLMNIIIFI